MNKKRIISLLLMLVVFVLPFKAFALESPVISTKAGAVELKGKIGPNENINIVVEKDGKIYFLDTVFADEQGNYKFQTVLPQEIEFDASLTAADQTINFKIQSDNTNHINVTGISLSLAKGEIKEKESLQLLATVSPENASNKEVVWTSTNPEIARISESGLVTGVLAGTTTITARSKDGGKVATALIQVTKATNNKPSEKLYVTISIDKESISKGYVLYPTQVAITPGDTVWDVLANTLDKLGISYRSSDSSQYNSIYVESIDGDAEFDHGPGSGWKYSVDGTYPEQGASLHSLYGNEVIKWRYTTNLGADLGDGLSGGGSTGAGGPGGSPADKIGLEGEISPELKVDQDGKARSLLQIKILIKP